MQLLQYGVTANPSCSMKDGTKFGEWANCWAGKEIDHLNGKCGTSSAIAHTSWVPWLGYTDVYKRFFYEQTVVGRASSIIHEARHAQGWCSHKGSCKRGNSCDPDFWNGCVGFGSSKGAGANAYQVIWLNHLAVRGRPERVNKAMKQAAVAYARSLLTDAFEKIPCLTMTDDGSIYEKCK